MPFPDIWPKELRIHYGRLNRGLRETFIAKVKSATRENEDPLKRFLIVMNQMKEELENYKDHPEFIFFALKMFFFEGKNAKVIELASEYPQHPGLVNLKADALIFSRKFEEVPDLLTKAKNLSRDSDPEIYLSVLASDILYCYFSQSFEQIPEKLSELTEKYQQQKERIIDNETLRLMLLEMFIQGKSVEISLNRRRGDLEQGAKIGKELISQARTTENRFLLNKLLNNTALCLIESGFLKEGLEFLEEAFAFEEVLGNELRIAALANNIGFIYRQMGNLDIALKYFERVLLNAEGSNLPPYIIVATKTNIALANLASGKPEMALEKSEEALTALKESNIPTPPRIKIDLDLCRADIFENLDRFKEAADILDFALMEINQAKLKPEIAKVYLRKAHLAARQSNLGDANKFLEETLEIALRNNLFETIVNAKLQLAEIALIRYRITGQKQLLEEAIEKIEDIEQLCLEQDYKIILIDIYILQGLLLSLEGQQKKGVKVLKKAIEISQSLNLPEKSEEARKQLKEIKGEKMNLLVRIFTRMTSSIRSTFSFESVTKPKTVETKIKAFYIFSKDSSLPIYEKFFDERMKINAGLLSGLLSAIRTMGERILDSREGGLRLIDHGDVAIMLEIKRQRIFALVLTKETFFAREKLREFAETLDLEPLLQENAGIIVKDERKIQEIDKLVEKNFGELFT